MLVRSFASLYILFIILAGCADEKNNKILIEGQWQVRLDSARVGKENQWASEQFSGTPIQLPGTLDDAELGPESKLAPALNNYVLSHLTRKHQYIGPAWYQREITIPDDWADKAVELKLERVIWESEVYVDGKKIGMQESLIAPHYYDLTGLSPGKHTLTIRIDNAEKYPFINVHGSRYPDPAGKDMAHAYTNHTQIKWNGIIGEMSVSARDKVHLSNAQVFPDADKGVLGIQLAAENLSGAPWEGKIFYTIRSGDGEQVLAGEAQANLSKATSDTISFEIVAGTKLAVWDEFNPVLYSLHVSMGKNGEKKTSELQVRFGVRDVENKDGVLTLNNRRIFLRGNLECAIFPLTGYPYTDKSDWAKMIKTAKAYGLNHLRFHSWCPPKAAFDAADEAGFYFQVELPHWSSNVGEDKATTAFLKKEANKLLAAYGNHPSFLLMSLGNELSGDAEVMNQMVKSLKEMDNRHLYATTTFSFQKGMGKSPQPEDEFFVTQYTDQGWVRGQGIFNSHPPHFDKDYSAVIDTIKVPLISHEIGQYSVFPDMTEIEKYTGVLQPLNFIAIRNDLEKKGLLELSDDFTMASGKLAALLYKEEIERALKTPGFDGFQLLQLQDFPGQGTALVGLLNAFWESKGIISPREFREFCSEIVPLLRFEKAVYIDGEVFEATVEIANFYEIKNDASLVWEIKDEEGNVLAGNELKNVKLRIGNNRELGNISFPIETDVARRLTVSLKLKGTPFRNSWPIWIYPEKVTTSGEEILITGDFQEAEQALAEGRKVLLNPAPETLRGIKGRFVPVFWSPVHFPDQPGTMGILCDPQHAAFQQFPTRSHTEWQWWDLCINSKSLIIDEMNVKPIVRVIDNFVTNHHLSNVFEAKVGDGKLLFSSIDLQTDLQKRPVARQLLHSLLNYMKSENYNPDKEVKFEEIKSAFQAE